MGAPICSTTPTPATQTKLAPLVNSIPIASDLSTAIAAINALRQVVNGLLGANTQGNGGQGPGPNPNNTGGGFTSKSQFQVANQVTKTTRIYDPNDPSKQTYVDVDQIVGLTMMNPVTRETWQWTQPAQAGS